MKPAPFAYHAPAEVDGVLALLAEHGDDAKVLAGGQSLVPMMAMRLATPARLVDLGGIGDLATLSFGDGIRIGAGVTQRALERTPQLRTECPLLAEALPHIAHPPIRNRGTVCGSLAHADPAAELPAVMLALDAGFVVRSARGDRRIPADEFFVSFLTTALEPDELLVEVQLPPAPATSGSAFVELSRRSGDFALAGIAASVVVRDGNVADARLAACGLGSTPLRLRQGEAALVGQQVAGLDSESLSEIAVAATEHLDPPSDVHAPGSYRRRVAGVLVREALASAIDRVGSTR